MSVGLETLKQLGGKRFWIMTGAKDFVFLDNGLSFRLPGRGGYTKNGIYLVKILLNDFDTYDVFFGRMRAGKIKVVSEHKGVYNDMLVSIFEQETGLYTKL